MVERSVRDAEVTGSSPVAPTINFMRKRIHVFYAGRVQGVGFRYALLDIAKQKEVCGWVKNLDDGRVEVVAQAGEDILKSFLEEINQQFSSYIKDLNVEWLPASLSGDELSSFKIKF